MQNEYSQKELENILKKYTGLPDLNISRKSKRIIKKKISQQEDFIINNKTSEELDKITSIPIISLTSWIKKYRKSILRQSQIKILEFNIVGISNDEYLLVKVPHVKGGEISPGIKRKELLMFRNINKIPVLDLDISDISMYSSGIRMIHPFNNGFIKCYTGKPNYLIASMTNEQLIPYYIIKVKNNNFLLYKENTINIQKIINEIVDKEKIKILYSVILKEKNWDNMRTNADIINYFLNLQKNIKDIMHHIKIDNIIIGMLTDKYPANHNIAKHVSYQLK